MRALLDFFIRHRGDRVLLAVHSQADTDTLVSALALKEYFTEGFACVPDSLSSQARKLNERFNGDVLKYKDMTAKPAALLILDSNSYAMLGEMAGYVRGFKGEIGVIDHHSIHTDAIQSAHSFVDNGASSTSEIIYEMFRLLNFPISRRNAELLLIGIIYDSADFRNATTRTLEIVTYLLKRTKLTLPHIFALVEEHDETAKRIGILKALARAKIYRAGDFIFATSSASAYEATAASRLVALGADYAFVVQETHHELRISGRCKPELVGARHADVSAILTEVGKFIGGTGGGHPAAAGANGPKRELLEQALARCVELARIQIRASALERINA